MVKRYISFDDGLPADDELFAEPERVVAPLWGVVSAVWSWFLILLIGCMSIVLIATTLGIVFRLPQILDGWLS